MRGGVFTTGVLVFNYIRVDRQNRKKGEPLREAREEFLSPFQVTQKSDVYSTTRE